MFRRRRLTGGKGLRGWNFGRLFGLTMVIRRGWLSFAGELKIGVWCQSGAAPCHNWTDRCSLRHFLNFSMFRILHRKGFSKPAKVGGLRVTSLRDLLGRSAWNVRLHHFSACWAWRLEGYFSMTTVYTIALLLGLAFSCAKPWASIRTIGSHRYESDPKDIVYELSRWPIWSSKPMW